MKTNYLPLIVFLLIANVAVSQDIAYSEKLIDKVERIKLSNILQSKKGTAPKRSISPYLMEAKKNWSRLTSNARSYFSSVRPVLTGTEVIFLSVYFDIHYTISGADAVDTTDIDANGTPDYVEDMAIEADNVYLKDSLRGFTMPPPDAGDGGSNYDDIYIFDLEPGVYGYVEPENNIGDNPNSPGITELSSTTSYVAMRNDYSGFMGDELDNIKATLAHEFSHAIDFGYSEDFSLFFLESKGPWEEQKLYPSITDNYQYLPNIFSYPDVALDWSDYDGTNGVEYDQHWYAGWIFLKYITEHTNDDIILAFLTRGITDSDELSFIDDELDANWNSDFSTMFGNWLIANIVMDSDPAYEPYTYANADAYGTYIGANGDQYVEDEFTYTGTAISWESDVDGNSRLMRLSADYFGIDPNQNFQIKLTRNDTSAEVDMVLLKANNTAGTLTVQAPVSSGSDRVIDVNDESDYDAFILVIGREDASVSDTLSEQYTLTIGSIPTRIGDAGTKDFIDIYPNPVSQQLFIEHDYSHNLTIEVRDVLGRIIYQFNATPSTSRTIINTKQMIDGIYFLTIKEEEQIISNKKIIVSR